ncbi:class I SAM-dependent methyltransferase [Deinococcus radiopugnans]|uniref:class I SAM-dependent methyltransferase n=1 Tax=Deinococcus radiopugnans TaxID=57497 RepID=UPI000690965A|nr:class I SAM-dependent methyltransferase [Deinococcus radiopugnans]
MTTVPSATTYDAYADFYTALVQAMLDDQHGFWQATRAVFDARLQGRLPGAVVLDVACGEGHLGRHLTQFGPDRVTGTDVSTALLERARGRAEPYGGQLQYLHDDAQTLTCIDTASVDVAVSNLAIMDIPDHARVFAAVRRVLRPGGVFVFSMMHSCFEAPFDEQGQFLMDPDQPERRAAYTIRRYATEGRWFAGKEGMRSRVGAHHRTLSTILCSLLEAGLTLTHLSEPVTVTGDLGGEVPRTLVIEVRA